MADGAPPVVSAHGLSVAAGEAFTAAEIGTVTLTRPADDVTVEVEWGDSTESAAALVGSGRTLWITGGHSYPEAGMYNFVLIVQDPGSEPVIVGGTVDVGQATEGIAKSFDLLDFSDANPLATTDDFTADVNWGEGGEGTAEVVQTGATFSVQGTATWQEEGDYNVQTEVVDNHSTVSSSSDIVVSDAPLAGTALLESQMEITEGFGATLTVASFSDANPDASSEDFTAVIDWGDGTQSVGVVDGGFTVRPASEHRVRLAIRPWYPRLGQLVKKNLT